MDGGLVHHHNFQDGRVSVLFAADVPCSGCIVSLYRLIVVCEGVGVSISTTFHLYGDVTVADVGMCSAIIAIEQ